MQNNISSPAPAGRNWVQIGGFAVWMAATALFMLHNGEATYARATADQKMTSLRAFVEAALTVLTIEVVSVYFLYVASRPETTPQQRTVAGWGISLSVAFGVLINLISGLDQAQAWLNLLSRGAQGVCLVLIARWHWVSHAGESLAAQFEAALQSLRDQLVSAQAEAETANATLAETIRNARDHAEWQAAALDDLRRKLQTANDDLYVKDAEMRAASQTASPQLQAAASERNITQVVAVTDRTRNVATLRSQGQTAKDIAGVLGVSVRTVESEISKAKAAGLLVTEVKA